MAIAATNARPDQGAVRVRLWAQEIWDAYLQDRYAGKGIFGLIKAGFAYRCLRWSVLGVRACAPGNADTCTGVLARWRHF